MDNQTKNLDQEKGTELMLLKKGAMIHFDTKEIFAAHKYQTNPAGIYAVGYWLEEKVGWDQATGKSNDIVEKLPKPCYDGDGYLLFFPWQTIKVIQFKAETAKVDKMNNTASEG